MKVYVTCTLFIRMKIKLFSCETFSASTRSKEANGNSEVEVKSACIGMCQAAHQASTYSSFCSMWLEVFLLSPGRDASPSRGYSQHLICQCLFIHLSGYWGTVRVKCLAQKPRLPEIEKKYKYQVTDYLHRLLVTFKMYNNLFWLELEHCFKITLYKMKSLNEFTIFTCQSKIGT